MPQDQTKTNKTYTLEPAIAPGFGAGSKQSPYQGESGSSNMLPIPKNRTDTLQNPDASIIDLSKKVKTAEKQWVQHGKC